MGSFSIWHWVIVLVVILVLFGGGGKLSRIMGDAARGINAFKKGLKDDKVNDAGSTLETPSNAAKPEGADAVSVSPNNDEAPKS